jgi:hypothetical protein
MSLFLNGFMNAKVINFALNHNGRAQKKHHILMLRTGCSFFRYQIVILAFANSLVWTCLSARTAANASVGVNYIDVTLADSASWTHIHASSTCYTIVTNYVCHNDLN